MKTNKNSWNCFLVSKKPPKPTNKVNKRDQKKSSSSASKELFSTKKKCRLMKGRKMFRVQKCFISVFSQHIIAADHEKKTDDNNMRQYLREKYKTIHLNPKVLFKHHRYKEKIKYQAVPCVPRERLK